VRPWTAGTQPHLLRSCLTMTANSASAPKDAIFSISFPTKPENDRQTRITAEISQYFTSRGCQVVFQQDVPVSTDVAWSLILLVRIPSDRPELRAMRQSIDRLLKSDRLGCFQHHTVIAKQCNAAQSRALDQGLCHWQDQSVDALPCTTPGPAASGRHSTLHAKSVLSCISAAGSSDSTLHAKSVLSCILQAAILTTWLGRRAATA
jgi:hypothetical protein